MDGEALIKCHGDFMMCMFLDATQKETGQTIEGVIETGRKFGSITCTDQQVAEIAAMVREYRTENLGEVTPTY